MGNIRIKVTQTTEPIKMTILLTIIPTILIIILIIIDSNNLSRPEPFLYESTFLFQGEKKFNKSGFIEKYSNKNLARFFHVMNKEIIALV